MAAATATSAMTPSRARPRARGGSSLPPRAVIVSRPGELDELVQRHGTLQQARFYLDSRGETVDDLRHRQQSLEAALQTVRGAIPTAWRRARVLRHELDRFLFEPEDIVVAVGQDGLVANVAKYLVGQPVVGVNPSRRLYEGALVRHEARAIPAVFADFERGRLTCEERTMVEARLADGQRLVALNEVFLGHRTHQSARYRITYGEHGERQSSSGVIVTTGTGASGWARSITARREGAPPLPAPVDPALAFFVREAWPSVRSGTTVTDGVVAPGGRLALTSEMNEGGTVFGDGIEQDRLEWHYGLTVEVSRAEATLRLVA